MWQCVMTLPSPYLSPEARETRVDELARALGAEIEIIGESHEGRAIRLVKVPAAVSGADTPKVLCCATIHGPEFVANLVALQLLRDLVRDPARDPVRDPVHDPVRDPVRDPARDLARDLGRNDDSRPATRLRNTAEVHVIACVNPDGYARTWASAGRGKLAQLRTNARGVDLNRNFPLPRGAKWWPLPGAGSRTPGDATYRGACEASEPETRALMELFARENYRASANLHSFMGTVIPARVHDRQDYRNYCRLARAFRDAQVRVRYRRLAHRIFDTFTGEQEDYQHHEHGTWAACIETFPVLSSLRQHWRAPSLFWRFNPYDPRPWLENDAPAVAEFLAHACTLPRPRQTSSVQHRSASDGPSG